MIFLTISNGSLEPMSRSTLIPTRTGIIALWMAIYSIVVATKNQSRSERLTLYQYKLSELWSRIQKAPEVLKQEGVSFLEILQILKENQKEYMRVYNKMIKEFSLDEI